jgi:hypothetical protein
MRSLTLSITTTYQISHHRRKWLEQVLCWASGEQVVEVEVAAVAVVAEELGVLVQELVWPDLPQQ